MNYFKVSNTYGNTATLFSDINNLSGAVIKKHHNISISDADGTCTVSCAETNISYNITNRYGNTSSGRFFANDDLITSSYSTNGKGDVTVQYGEYETEDYDIFSFYDATNSKTFNVVYWEKDNDVYTLHTCDTQASIATDNSIISAGSSFYNLKDFGTDFVAQIKNVNAPTNKFVIQPLIASGVKTPLYLMTGAYSANPPLFTEFTYGNDTYLVVGTNYCIKV